MHIPAYPVGIQRALLKGRVRQMGEMGSQCCSASGSMVKLSKYFSFQIFLLSFKTE